MANEIASGKKEEKSAQDLMLEVMLKREAREAAEHEVRTRKEAANKSRRDYLLKMREESDKENADNLISKQANCDHRKGTTWIHKSMPAGIISAKQIDFMVNRHTFGNGQQRVKCEKCGMKWYPGDTQEFLIRRDSEGKTVKIPNHTKFNGGPRDGQAIGWAEALWMSKFPDQTTNTPTRAEVVWRGNMKAVVPEK